MVRVADYIIDRLHEAGIRHIFTVNGRGILYLTDAVARRSDVDGISVNHEQAAAYAAVGYAQYSEGMGACLVSTGCAGTNAMTGVLCAWQDNVPCVFLSGNNMLGETTRYRQIPLRTFGQQETDIISLVTPVTKYAVMITDASRIAYEVDKALYLAQEGRKGPVWIDVPLNIQDARIEPERLERYEAREHRKGPEAEAVAYAADRLREAKRPVILFGSGVRAAGAAGLLKQFAGEHEIPLTYSASAPDVIGAKEDIVIGTVGSMGGTRAGNFAVQNSDVLLVLGNRLSPVTTSGEYEKFAREAEIIVVDIDPVEHSKDTVRIDRFIEADAGEFLRALQQCMAPVKYSDWLQKCLHWKEIFPICEEVYRNAERVDLYELAEKLSAVLKEDTALCTDAGLEELILPANVRFGRNQKCIHPNAQGAMGYSIPAAIGAYYAGAKNVVVVVGDGSVMMNIQELQTIHYRQLPIKILIINNNGYAIIRRRQKNLFRKRTIGNDESDGLGLADFEGLAAGFGVAYDRIDSPDELTDKLELILEKEEAVLCEIMGVEDQNYLHSSFAKNKDRKIVKRPLEDQSPFLPRELLEEEMVIELMDQ